MEMAVEETRSKPSAEPRADTAAGGGVVVEHCSSQQAESGAADTAAGGGVVEQQAERGAADTAKSSSITSSVELRTSLVNAQLTRMLKSKKWSYILMVRIIIDLLSYP